jgi:RNA polymerase sigma factor (sigma-70 family)
MEAERDLDPVGTSFETAFPTLFRRAQRLAYRILGDTTAAEDVAAEALARALVHWGRISHLPYRDGWVLRVTTNLAFDASRKQARRRQLVLTDDVVAASEEAVVLRSALVAALGALPRRQREAIVLVHLVGLTPTEAASAMHVSISSVGHHVRRAIDRLRQELPMSLVEPLAQPEPTS